MNIKVLSWVLILLCALPAVAAPPKGKSSSLALQVDNSAYIDVNRILMYVTNHGNFARDLGGYFGYDYGTFFPYSGDTSMIRSGQLVSSPLYAGGLWIGAIDSATGQNRVIISEYSDEYVPGPMQGGTFMTDRPEFRVYKLYGDSLKGYPNQDYLDYMTYAVQQGAPVMRDAEDSLVPAMAGDQMCWSVYNDADPTQHTNASGETAPLGLEVKHTTFAYNRQGALGNIIILKLQVFNKGGNTLQNCFLSLWVDPDLGGAGDDLVGCDTLLSIGYVYNDNNADQYYGATPPCAGVDFFQGPLRARTDADTFPDGTPMFGRMWGQIFPDSVNIGMTSFDKYINGTDPDNATESYNYMRGLTRDGQPYVFEGDTLKFVCSGNPITDEGDLDIAPADRRFMMSTGPITFRPGDSTEILAAIIVGQGQDRLNSIEVMRQLDEFAQQLYENGFNPPRPPAKPNVTLAQLSKEITLSWTDTSQVDPGDYIFEGYTVWQGQSSSGPWRELATYDVDNDRGVALIDSVKDLRTGLVLPDIQRALRNSGLNYHYSTTVDALAGGKLRDVTDYYFRVTAFSFDYYYKDKLVPNGDRFLESQTVLKVTPQAPRAGVLPTAQSHDTLEVDHAGPSDGAVYPLVLDPMALTGDVYRVFFEEDNPIGYDAGIPLGVVWHLLRYRQVTPDSVAVDTLQKNQTNQTGDDNYFTYDGLLMKITGPALAGQSWSYTTPDTANVSPVAVADNPDYEGHTRWFTGEPGNGGELLFGAIFMEPNFWGETSLGPLDYPTVEIRWRPMASYTDLDGDGHYTIGEPYVVDSPSLTQKAFMYKGFDSTKYLGYFDVPFTAWDVSNSDPDSARQLNVVMRDRDQNHQWDMNFLAQPPDTLLPNDGDLQYNYTWITTTSYDPTGTYYGDGIDGSINFWGFDDGNGIWDAAWTLWLYNRFTGGPLAEQCVLTLVPPVYNLLVDTFTFHSTKAGLAESEVQLDKIKAVPNPFYLYGGYDPNPGSKEIRFHHLPTKCAISIYNIAGDLIRTIDKDDASTAIAGWDLLTERGLPVASGIYIYVVDAPGFGTKVGKMAIFTESEVLQLY